MQPVGGCTLFWLSSDSRPTIARVDRAPRFGHLSIGCKLTARFARLFDRLDGSGHVGARCIVAKIIHGVVSPVLQVIGVANRQGAAVTISKRILIVHCGVLL